MSLHNTGRKCCSCSSLIDNHILLMHKQQYCISLSHSRKSKWRLFSFVFFVVLGGPTFLFTELLRHRAWDYCNNPNITEKRRVAVFRNRCNYFNQANGSGVTGVADIEKRVTKHLSDASDRLGLRELKEQQQMEHVKICKTQIHPSKE